MTLATAGGTAVYKLWICEPVRAALYTRTSSIVPLKYAGERRVAADQEVAGPVAVLSGSAARLDVIDVQGHRSCRPVLDEIELVPADRNLGPAMAEPPEEPPAAASHWFEESIQSP